MLQGGGAWRQSTFCARPFKHGKRSSGFKSRPEMHNSVTGELPAQAYAPSASAKVAPEPCPEPAPEESVLSMQEVAAE